MTDQLRIAKLPPADGALGVRQAFVLDLLRDHPQGLRATDIGRHLHVDRDSPCACGEDVTCKYARGDALETLRGLRGDGKGAQARRLVTYHRQPGTWHATTGVRHLPDPHGPTTGPIPF